MLNEVENNINLHIGQVINMQRKLCKLTLQELAKLLGISYQQLQKYEKGTNKISAEKLHKIAEVLKINPAQFFPNNANLSLANGEQQRQIFYILNRINDEVIINATLTLLKRVAAIRN